MDIILTNSKNTQTRIKKYLGLESRILYPPVDMDRFQDLGNEGYFLSFARLADAKRVDKIVEAFQLIPEEKLIVIYGQNDPQKEKILSMAQNYSNIVCIHLEDNDELYHYVGNARATIYIPIDEDFGMSPVESMSAGKPVLGVNEGGLKESIIHEETGFLLDPDFSIDNIISAVRYLDSNRCFSMKKACIQQAQRFSIENFSEKLLEIIEESEKH